MSGRLTDGFREIIELPWSEFVELEQNPDATNFDAIITSIARAAVKGNLRAIQTALDRLDGKIAAEIEVEYPKFYTIYPRATRTADDPDIIDANGHSKLITTGKVNLPYEPVVDMGSGVKKMTIGLEEEEEELPTGSLRAVLEKMLASPKKIVDDMIGAVAYIDQGDLQYGDPKVKSVIVAGLMRLVHEGRISAVFEVFDQIDGKVADKYKMLGDDVYMQNFALVAPAGAYKNEDGVYVVEADNTTNSWVTRLEEKAGGKRR